MRRKEKNKQTNKIAVSKEVKRLKQRIYLVTYYSGGRV